MPDLRIIYKDPDSGVVAVINPSVKLLETRTIQEIADKDVPHGCPYKIIEFGDLPSDRTFRNAWEVDESILTDGVGAESTLFAGDSE